MTRIADLHDLMVDQLRDMYSAEKQLVQTLPRMVQAATAPDLQAVLRDQLSVTKAQVARLDDVFTELQVPARAKHCRGMDGLLEEGREMVLAKTDPTVRDAGLISAAEKAQHYQIAAYSILIELATKTSNVRVADLLRISLMEEQESDERLTRIAPFVVRQATQSRSLADLNHGFDWNGRDRRLARRSETTGTPSPALG